MTRRRLAWAVACSRATAFGSPPRAQNPITIVTSFGSASVADIVARLLAAEFTPMLGTQMVVKNAMGAAGTIAVNEVVRARPDGNTLLFSPTGPIPLEPRFMRNAGYRATDLAPVYMANKAPLVMIAPANSGLRTVADVAARAGPKKARCPTAAQAHPNAGRVPERPRFRRDGRTRRDDREAHHRREQSAPSVMSRRAAGRPAGGRSGAGGPISPASTGSPAAPA